MCRPPSIHAKGLLDANLAYGFTQRHWHNLRWAKGRHLAEPFFRDHLYGNNPESGAAMAVNRRGRTTALEVPKATGQSFFSSLPLYLAATTDVIPPRRASRSASLPWEEM